MGVGREFRLLEFVVATVYSNMIYCNEFYVQSQPEDVVYAGIRSHIFRIGRRAQKHGDTLVPAGEIEISRMVGWPVGYRR